MTAKNEPVFVRIKSGSLDGLKKGWHGLLWLLKIILPVSFLTALLINYGMIYKFDFILAPLMKSLCLPASAAIVIIAGLFTGIYGTVAALNVMPFSMDHMILIAIFTLISHNLFQESLVQGQSGMNTAFAAAFRLTMAYIVTFACAKAMGVAVPAGEDIAAGTLQSGTLQTGAQPFKVMLRQWGWDTFRLCAKIVCIILPLMVVLELAKTFNIITYITRLTAPVLAVMGLQPATGMLWLTAAVFGLAYGSAVIVEDTQNHAYDKDELTRLHLSIGINHAMVEDPALFLPLGLPLFWLWIPRLLAAMAVAWLHWGYSWTRRVCAK